MNEIENDKTRKPGLLRTIWETVAGAESCCTPGSGCCGSPIPTESIRGEALKTLKIYDPPMCCSSGACGPQVDPALVRFAADLKWIEGQGVAVERYNLAQSPMAFAENTLVRAWLTDKGEEALPLIVVEGKVVASGDYPARDELTGLLGLTSVGAS